MTAPFVLMCAAVFLAANAPNVFYVVPRYLRAAGQDERHIGMVMGTFSLASLSAMPAWARVAERRGARAVLLAGMTLVAAGCAAFEPARSLPGWMASRALQGLGWSAVLTGQALAATVLAPPGRMGEALGFAGVLTLVAMALGPIFGEQMAAHVSWPWVFRGGAISASAGVVAALFLPRLEARASTHDDAAAPAPIVDPSQLLPMAAMLLVATGFGAVVSFLSDHAHRAGAGRVSPFFDAYVATAVLVRLVAGHWSDRVGRHPVIVPSMLGQAGALVGLAYVHASWQLWLWGALFGVTHGLYYPALAALILERAPAARQARAAAAGNFSFNLGIAVTGFGGGALAGRFGYPPLYLATAGCGLVAMALIARDRVSSRA